MSLLARAVSMWLLLLVVMMGNGTLRVLVLQPRLGEETARQLATVTGILLVLALSRAFARWSQVRDRRALLRVGLLWLTLTLAFEFGFGYAAGRGLQEMLADYAIWRGRLWPLLLVATLLGPWLMARGVRPEEGGAGSGAASPGR
jgi:hypothetical protein